MYIEQKANPHEFFLFKIFIFVILKPNEKIKKKSKNKKKTKKSIRTFKQDPEPIHPKWLRDISDPTLAANTEN